MQSKLLHSAAAVAAVAAAAVAAADAAVAVAAAAAAAAHPYQYIELKTCDGAASEAMPPLEPNWGVCTHS